VDVESVSIVGGLREQRAAGEHGDVDVRRLEQTAGTGDRARLTVMVS